MYCECADSLGLCAVYSYVCFVMHVLHVSDKILKACVLCSEHGCVQELVLGCARVQRKG